MATAGLATTETYRLSRFGFTNNSVLADKDIEILLRDDGQDLGIASTCIAIEGFRFHYAARGQQGAGDQVSRGLGHAPLGGKAGILSTMAECESQGGW